MQTRTQSVIESIANVMVGYLVALAAQMVVFPIMGIAVRIDQNIMIGVIFTGVSLARSYILRRIFNKLHTP